MALAQASDWSPRVADNMFLLYTCPKCRKACVNQGGWWITYTGSGRRSFRCRRLDRGVDSDLRFFGTTMGRKGSDVVASFPQWDENIVLEIFERAVPI